MVLYLIASRYLIGILAAGHDILLELCSQIKWYLLRWWWWYPKSLVLLSPGEIHHCRIQGCGKIAISRTQCCHWRHWVLQIAWQSLSVRYANAAHLNRRPCEWHSWLSFATSCCAVPDSMWTHLQQSAQKCWLEWPQNFQYVISVKFWLWQNGRAADFHFRPEDLC